MEANASNEVGTVSASFRTTHWSVVLRAGAPDPEQFEAIEQLCRNY
ncbi:MAG: hypothetical protein L0Z50_24175 [Verrucomicrobiales bacterium]|nr:hypothetical protein [Verrucomicrobiales bacterium]